MTASDDGKLTTKTPRNPIFPPGFIAETLRTLALLFPEGDANTRKWYTKQADRDELDFGVLKCGPVQRRIEGYSFWHDRLVVLNEEFNEARPTTFVQWWNDRRDGLQWYAVWVAIGLTIFFGLVQSIEGAMQVYKAWHPSDE